MGKKERWRHIIGYKGLYQISNRGKVKSLDRKVFHYRSGFQWIRGYKLKLADVKGYKAVKLYREGHGRCFLVHRLVAIHFLKNPLKKKEVNHRFGKKDDNRVSQLEWLTPLENALHARRTGLTRHVPPQLGIKGESNWKSRPVNQLSKKGVFVKRFGGAAEAERETGIDSSSIIKVAKGLAGSAGGYKWEYTKRLKKYKRKTRKQILKDYNKKIAK